MKTRDSHYGSSSIIRSRDGPQTNSSYKNWGRHTEEKPGPSKEPFFKDFDEFHNFGLEKQTTEEVKYYMLPIPLYNTSICYPHSILALKLYYWTFIIRQKSDSQNKEIQQKAPYKITCICNYYQLYLIPYRECKPILFEHLRLNTE